MKGTETGETEGEPGRLKQRGDEVTRRRKIVKCGHSGGQAGRGVTEASRDGDKEF